MSKITNLIENFEENGILGTRMECTLNDLNLLHSDLSDREIADLYCALHNRAEFKGIDFDNIPAEIIKEYMKETLHNSFDGWREDTHDTIEALMFDIMRYAKHSR